MGRFDERHSAKRTETALAVSVIVTVQLQVKSDRLDTIRQLFASLLHETRARDGNEAVTVHVDQDNPSHMPLIEHWKSRADYVAYHKSRAARGDLNALAQCTEDVPKRIFYDFLPV